MYEEFYGFVRPPFTLSPDPRFLYRSESHDEAITSLLQAIRRREGFIVLAGDIGTGKTTICRALLEQLDQAAFTCLILNPFLSVEELLREILLDFGIVSRDAVRSGRLASASKHELIRTLHDFLLSLAAIRGSGVLIIDEAQHLSADVLEQIRVISNMETSESKLLQIVLVGQLDLLDTLGGARMRQLDQRVSLRALLRPLPREEADAYVAHRLLVAGGTSAIRFAPGALEVVHAHSGGVPRVINLLCDRALMVGADAGATVITPDAVHVAAARLNLKPTDSVGQPLRPRWQRRVVAAAVIAVVLAAIAVIAPVHLLVDAPLPAMPGGVRPVVAPPTPVPPVPDVVIPIPPEL
jgi:general secretion pathway protein A